MDPLGCPNVLGISNKPVEGGLGEKMSRYPKSLNIRTEKPSPIIESTNFIIDWYGVLPSDDMAQLQEYISDSSEINARNESFVLDPESFAFTSDWIDHRKENPLDFVLRISIDGLQRAEEMGYRIYLNNNPVLREVGENLFIAIQRVNQAHIKK